MGENLKCSKKLGQKYMFKVNNKELQCWYEYRGILARLSTNLIAKIKRKSDIKH